ncbi:MAG: 2Fe-2S iron-sulfur cluster-binding protein [Fibrobacterota bacterium]
MDKINFSIDNNDFSCEKGKTIVEAAKENGIYIPVLCYFEGLKPVGTCRICTVKVNGKPMAACTTMVTEGMDIEFDTPELNDMRKAIVEMLFVEGNHFCPSCEKSGNCELQALAYKFQMMVPRFLFAFPLKDIDATHPKLILERNRCVLCKRCVRGIKTENGRSLFALSKRGSRVSIEISKELADQVTDELAEKAMEICPVGAIIKKEKGFDEPIGTRRFDKNPIGSDIEKK